MIIVFTKTVRFGISRAYCLLQFFLLLINFSHVYSSEKKSLKSILKKSEKNIRVELQDFFLILYPDIYHEKRVHFATKNEEFRFKKYKSRIHKKLWFSCQDEDKSKEIFDQELLNPSHEIFDVMNKNDEKIKRLILEAQNFYNQKK